LKESATDLDGDAAMNLSDLSPGDVLASTDENGTGFYRVVKVHKKTVKVATEQGSVTNHYPEEFDRKLSAEAVTELHAEGINI
jgi:hypothetical protein